MNLRFQKTLTNFFALVALSGCSIAWTPPKAVKRSRNLGLSAAKLDTIPEELTAVRGACLPLSFRLPPWSLPTLPESDDPYVLLDLDPSNPPADEDEIKRSYKRLARLYHPDAAASFFESPEDRKLALENFERINEAYARLTQSDNDAGQSPRSVRRRKKPSPGGETSGPADAEGRPEKSRSAALVLSRSNVDWMPWHHRKKETTAIARAARNEQREEKSDQPSFLPLLDWILEDLRAGGKGNHAGEAVQ